jgi:YD repeat-containing protein
MRYNAINQLRQMLAAAIVLSVVAPAAAQTDHVFESAGFQQNHDYFTEGGGESIDTLTGNLILTQTDLVLPGNAGRDVRFQRIYNSSSPRMTEAGTYTSGEWIFGIEGYPATAVFEPSPVPGGPPPYVVTFDGAKHYGKWRPAPPVCPDSGGCQYYLTQEFWLIDGMNHRVYYPDGTIDQFTFIDARGGLAVLSQRRDPFGNRVTFTRDGYGRIAEVTQTLAGRQGDVRTVVLTWEGASSSGIVRSLRYLTYEWTYEYDGGFLTRVRPPVGPGWTFEYARRPVPERPDGILFGNDVLSAITNPHGGTVRYEYAAHDSGERCYPDDRAPLCTVYVAVVSSRTIGGRSVAAGAPWQYEYPPSYDSMRLPTIVKHPDGVRTEVTYTDEHSAINEYGHPTQMQVGRRVIRDAQGAVQETEIRHYTNLLVSPVPRGPSYLPQGSAALLSVAVERDGRTYTTTHEYAQPSEYLADFHRPRQTVESDGALTRITTRTFRYDGFNVQPTAGRIILGKLAREVVTVGSESFEKSWTYDTATGFTLSATTYGLKATFTDDFLGNVASETRNGHTTRFSYRYGLVSEIATPTYTITREINPEGTVASETRGGRTTRFLYDRLFRIERSTPPGASDPIVTTYDNGSLSAVTVSRGDGAARFAVTTSLDGFGRPTGTDDSIGGHTRIRYDAEGRKIFESYPFTGAEIGTTIAYDALGRVRRRTQPDNSVVETAYGPGTVSITDTQRRTTVQTWAAFGSPEDARLTSPGTSAASMTRAVPRSPTTTTRTSG